MKCLSMIRLKDIRPELHVTSALNVPGLHFVHEPTWPCEMAKEHIHVCVFVCVCVCVCVCVSGR
jgi:hypothetical protein